METKKYDQAAYNRKSREKHGIRQKSFALDPDTIALLERLAAERGETQTAVFKAALNKLAEG
ncbi:Uncharacterised protein [Kingella potus]|uniref:Uncharacterized protein n=1 Tax=Kingella potus TaxID=265175 RepID=A0A377QYK3_9NEIS|nr:ribbon-helix-helix protein, CopG family [Kingella potus]UOP00558.1 ribbon-helix-helix protein, CopG family [Kingella potus]UOP01988.1 ribbon-helix-helix protein, CopG family [Kingella potus]STQ99820.1 Uncharacterised protein [Kingella potus]STR03048.1 Uncharacterised protein [Kingella potus]STR03061.1 Uncharacterised protein [Kingella potus]